MLSHYRLNSNSSLDLFHCVCVCGGVGGWEGESDSGLFVFDVLSATGPWRGVG